MIANEILNDLFKKNWSSECIISEAGSYKYSELYQSGNAIAEYLSAQGCSRGDCVAIILPNGMPFLSSYIACIANGFVFLPINPDLKKSEIDYILKRVECKFVLEEKDFIEPLDTETLEKPNFVTLGDQVSAIFFTSGTTGKPKGVCHSIQNMLDNVVAFNGSLGLDDYTNLYHILPMSYMAGFLNTFLSPILAGGRVTIGPKFSPAEVMNFWDRPKSFGVNTIWVTPTIASFLVRMNRDKEISKWTHSNLSKVFCGTAPLTNTTRMNFENTFKVPLLESYGMSEILLVSCQKYEDGVQEGSVGSLLEGIAVSSKKKDGELVVKTPFMFKKYILPQGESLEADYSSGMQTGDLGYLKDGSLFISGRIKDLIIKGGINISPKYLENIIESVDGAEEVAIVGFPHEFWGESVSAFIVLTQGYESEVVESRIKKILKQEVNASIAPDNYFWINEMPRSQNGKVLKNELVGNQP